MTINFKKTYIDTKGILDYKKYLKIYQVLKPLKPWVGDYRIYADTRFLHEYRFFKRTYNKVMRNYLDEQNEHRRYKRPYRLYLSNIFKHLKKNEIKPNGRPFNYFYTRFLYLRQLNTKNRKTWKDINTILWNQPSVTLTQFNIKKVFVDDTLDTHQQGRLIYTDTLQPILYDVNPAAPVKYLWSNYEQYLPYLPLKTPFRFDHSKFLNYRVLGKLMNYSYNKRKKNYDLYYYTGTHARMKLSGTNFWQLEDKWNFTEIAYNHLNSYNIYNSYSNSLKLPFNNFKTNNFLLNFEIKQKDTWLNISVSDLFKERFNFFAVSKPTFYSIDRLSQFNLLNSSIWAKHRDLYKTFFLSSFFNVKKFSHPFKFFRTLQNQLFDNFNLNNKFKLKKDLFYNFNYLNLNILLDFVKEKKKLYLNSRTEKYLNIIDKSYKLFFNNLYKFDLLNINDVTVKNNIEKRNSSIVKFNKNYYNAILKNFNFLNTFFINKFIFKPLKRQKKIKRIKIKKIKRIKLRKKKKWNSKKKIYNKIRK